MNTLSGGVSCSMSCVSISTSSIVSAILFVWVVCMLCCSINRCWRKVEEDACFTRRACPTRSIRAHTGASAYTPSLLSSFCRTSPSPLSLSQPSAKLIVPHQRRVEVASFFFVFLYLPSVLAIRSDSSCLLWVDSHFLPANHWRMEMYRSPAMNQFLYELTEATAYIFKLNMRNVGRA
jgi:hypothetical protein